jgi:hypothetical protein
MATRMQQRKGTAAQWVSTNNGDGPILNAGEIGYESDTNKFKIGDGVNHWVDLNYFLDAEALGGSIDDYVPLTQKGVANGVATLNSSGVIPSEQIPSLVGLDSEITTAVNNAIDALVEGAPAALSTLNDLAAAINDNTSFASEVIAEINTKQDIIDGVSDVEIGYLNGVHSAIQTQIDDIAADVSSLETNKADASTLAENIIDTMAGALTEGTDIVITHNDVANTITIAAGTGLATNTELADAVSNHSNDTTNVHGITDTAELATKTFAANLLVNATKTNIQITGDKDGISIVAENGVADSTTDNLSEGSTNKYYTDARVETKLSTSVRDGIEWDGVTNELYVDETTVQFRVANVSDTEIGYLNGVTSAIQDQLDDKAPIESPTFTGTVSGITKSMVGLGNVDNTADADKPISTATQTALDAKLASATAATTYAPIASPTLTGTATTNDLVVNGDFTVNGTNFAASATSITIEDNLVQLAHQNVANTVDLGLVVAYNDGAAKHAGIARDVSDDKWKLFKGVSTEPTTTVAFGEGSLDALAVGAFEATSATIGDVSNTELQYLNGVTSAVQTQLNAKAPLESPTFTGTVSGVTKAHVGLGNVDNTSDANKPVSTATQTALDAKANSLVTIDPETASYTLILTNQDQMVEMNVGSANTLTVPANSSVAFPIGTRIHVVQTGSGQTTITPAGGVTVNGTPGLKTRAQWSAVTLVKRATDTWVAFGDLTA